MLSLQNRCQSQKFNKIKSFEDMRANLSVDKTDAAFILIFPTGQKSEEFFRKTRRFFAEKRNILHEKSASLRKK